MPLPQSIVWLYIKTTEWLSESREWNTVTQFYNEDLDFRLLFIPQQGKSLVKVAVGQTYNKYDKKT